MNRALSKLSEKAVAVGAHQVHYLVEGGTGEPRVLLHGIFAEKDHWVDFARPLIARNAASNVRLWNTQLKDRYLLDNRIAAVQQPTLVLWVGSDQVFHASGAEVLRSRLKEPHIQVLAGVGHLPMMEAPRATAQRYSHFLGSLPAQS